MYFHSVALLFLLRASSTIQRSDYDSPTYMSAIVEYSPVMKSSDDQSSADLNAKNYLKIIDKAATYSIDVIVFPEGGLAVPSSTNRSYLASYIPDPADKVIPCNDQSSYYQDSLKNMSCAARDYQIYIVVDHHEKVDCNRKEDGCASDGLLIYNTNVAFDRKGQVVARYRKYNLFFEKGVNRTEPIPTAFKTDFGVTFGTFICFDLIFPLPALGLTRDLGITDVLYSTHWFDATPFGFATEFQAAWAYAYDVNLMASGLSFPDTGSGGSGIYLGKQGYVDVISENKKSNVLLVSEIPKVINGKRTRNIDRNKVHRYEFTPNEISTGEENEERKIHDMQMLNWSPFSSEAIDLKVKNQSKTICDKGLCCHFKFTIDFDQKIAKVNSNYYRYHYGAVNRTVDLKKFGPISLKGCAIMFCTDDTRGSCGKSFKYNQNVSMPITFTSLEISLLNITNENISMLPGTYTQSLIPLNVTDFTYEVFDTGAVSSYHMKLEKPVNDLLTFVIIGRSSEIDGFLNTYSVRACKFNKCG